MDINVFFLVFNYHKHTACIFTICATPDEVILASIVEVFVLTHLAYKHFRLLLFLQGWLFVPNLLFQVC